MEITKEGLAKMIDYTLLKPDATRQEIKKLCESAKRYGFNSVFVSLYYAAYAVRILKNSKVKVGIPIGFPLGYTTTQIKVEETKIAQDYGAQEIDMVINISALKSKDYFAVEEDIRRVVKEAKDCKVKVIIEACYLTDEEKIKAGEIIEEAGAAFVKTSTGFGPRGATVEDVRLLRKSVSKRMGIKASGGIRTTADAIKLIKAGATRIGTSKGVEIITGLR